MTAPSDPADALVIGSGPAGMACARALLEQGARVTLIDGGDDLAPGRADDRALQNDAITDGKVPLKTLFGDAFMYARAGRVLADDPLPAGFHQWPSLGVGGLSRVWGATMMRPHGRDLASWPVDEDELRPHFEAVERQVPVSARADGLAAAHPLAAFTHVVPASPQAEGLLARFGRQGARLAELGTRCGQSRLAVGSNCRLCGQCLHGCPHGVIFAASDWLGLLAAYPGFTYRPGLVAEQWQEQDERVMVRCRDKSGDAHVVAGRRLYCGAGVLASTLLVLCSLDAWDAAPRLADSQYFLLPFWGPAADAAPLHTLAQIFVEFDQPDICAHPVHTQLYTWNDMYQGELLSMLPAPLRRRPARWAAKAAARHLVVAQGYMHSRLSGGARLRLTGPRERPRLAVEPQADPDLARRVRRVCSHLGQIGRVAGLRTRAEAVRVAEIGRGYHSGACFPMTRRPQGLESDLLGRVGGWTRVHLIDASVWPDVPSAPMTLTVMANARRIALQSQAMDLG